MKAKLFILGQYRGEVTVGKQSIMGLLASGDWREAMARIREMQAELKELSEGEKKQDEGEKP